MKILKVLLLILFNAICSANPVLENNWQLMQQEYENLNTYIKKKFKNELEKSYSHPYWQTQKSKIQTLITGKFNPNFLKLGPIAATMVRSGFTTLQQYEVCYLQECIQLELRRLITSIQEPPFLNLPHDCKEFKCSANMLGHYFFAAKVMELYNKSIDTIIEFGGGYGNLARIFKNALPNSTIILIDFPELLALQYFFLKSSMQNTEIIVHTSAPTEFKKGAIHLIANLEIKNMHCNADVFISTFALSEAPALVQNGLIEKKFFNAQLSYLTGQLNGWGTKFNFVHHSVLHQAIKKLYSQIICQPFHSILNALRSYELIGIN